LSTLKRLAGETAIYGLSSIIGRLLNYLLVPLYTHVFVNPADYGVVSELYAWVAFLVVFLTFGMETTFFRFIQDAKDKASVFQNAFLTLLGLNAFFLLLILFFNQDIADAMLYSDHNEYIIILAIIVCIDAISSLPLAKLRDERKAVKFATIQFSAIIVNILLNLIFMLGFFNPERPEEGVMFILISNLISSLVKPLMLYKDFLQIQFKYNLALVKSMFVYAFPLVIAGFAGIINETLDRILLKHILFTPENSLENATAQVGIYSAVYKLAMLVTIFLQAYRYAAEPFFFSMFKNENRNKMYIRVMNVFIAAICFVFLIVSMNIDVFKHFIRNEAYWVGLGVVPILLLANVFFGIYQNQSIWYKLSGQTRFGAYIAIGGAILTVILNVLFIPIYGFYACAWATLIVYAAQMLVSYFLSQKYYPIKYNIRKFMLYLLTSLLFFGIAKLLDISFGWLQLFVHNALIMIFVGLVYVMEFKKTKST
jgi:O-antigen/teichoic acid export membrane protein